MHGACALPSETHSLITLTVQVAYMSVVYDLVCDVERYELSCRSAQASCQQLKRMQHYDFLSSQSRMVVWPLPHVLKDMGLMLAKIRILMF